MYTLRSRSIPLNTDYDVIVVGGGPSGCTAAAAAARTGAKTLLLEATGSLGGMGTSGLVPAWCPFSDKERIIYRGLAETVFERSKALSPHVAPTDVDWVPIDPEGLKRIYDDLMQEYGVTVLFNTFLCDVDAENGEVHAIVTANKAGFTAYSAKTYIDCTGDGDLAVWAGARYEFEEDGEPMPSTFSCDKRIQGSVRVMPVCLTMGEAAGVTAAFAANANGDVHAVDTDKLRETLRENGAYFH